MFQPSLRPTRLALRNTANVLPRLFSSRDRRRKNLASRPDVEVLIDRLLPTGKGIGKETESGRDCIVAGAVPGQLVRSKVFKARQNKPMEAKLTEIVKSGPHSTEPLCSSYFGTCGGCMHQNIAYTEQLRQKHLQISELFSSFTEHIRPAIGPHSSAGNYNYRNKMDFTCSSRKFYIEKDLGEPIDCAKSNTHFAVGMFPRSTGNGRWLGKVLPVESCHLQHSMANKILQYATEACQQSSLEAYDHVKNLGFLKLISIRSGERGSAENEEKEFMLTFTISSPDHDRLQPIVDRILCSVPAKVLSSLVSIRSEMDAESIRRCKNTLHHNGNSLETERVLFGRSFVFTQLGNKVYRVSGNSFFQPNTQQGTVLYDKIRDACMDCISVLNTRKHQSSDSNSLKPVIWDLFCGTGSIGIYVSDLASRVIGIEVIPEAIQDAKENAALNKVSNMEFKCLDLNGSTSILQDIELPKPEIVIVDPPRPGLHPSLRKLLLNVQPEWICYVSCNPTTQHDDIQFMSTDYEVQYCQPVDMLPHTPHIENICLLRRKCKSNTESNFG